MKREISDLKRDVAQKHSLFLQATQSELGSEAKKSDDRVRILEEKLGTLTELLTARGDNHPENDKSGYAERVSHLEELQKEKDGRHALEIAALSSKLDSANANVAHLTAENQEYKVRCADSEKGLKDSQDTVIKLQVRVIIIDQKRQVLDNLDCSRHK